ncbi:UDP-4-amino-4,6-dideoxy-N-acetyl-beta-L-altrosamine transaminase [Boseongicola sp. H5]|uniref:UDP-4-amino-4, 6-dideoxy-N-acetyl-beta-L-altrosamine transaminase n=1 Tax=Boseongicola sp. H5 TaxID=2763261 RepID=UPI001D0B2CC6
MIPYGRQDIHPEDIEAVVEVLKSDFLTQGPVVPAFEAAVATTVGAGFGVAVTNATAALHIACMALELGPNDLLWTSPITFVASANAARYCGAEVDFVDIDPDTFNMCPDALEAKLVAAKAAGRLPKIIMPVHMAGQSCDMARIGGLARRHGIKVIEDASHAIGGSHRAKPVGACAFSDIAVFSFHPVKIVTTGEGGMAMTNDAGLAERMQRLRSHGITRDPALMTQKPDGGWYYQLLELGFNYRMTDIQAALGLSQVSRLNDYVNRRNEIADYYDSALQSLPLHLPGRVIETRSAFHLYVVRLRNPARRNAVFDALREVGIGVNLHYIPVHLQPYYRALGFGPGAFPSAEAYYQAAISIPMFPTLSRSDQSIVVDALRGVCD